MNNLYNNADEAYHAAVRHVLDTGTRKPNRTGVDSISAFGVHYAIHMHDYFPLLTTKTIQWHHIVIEMLWFLSGRQDIDVLQKHGIKFWDAWADVNGEVPSAYGRFWRSFPATEPDEDFDNDQIAWVVDKIKSDPMSRRLVVSAWHPDNAQSSALPPCHFAFAFNVTPSSSGIPRYLNLHLTQRSADMALGVPYNIASYGLLLQLVARFTGLRTGTFSHTLVDAHVYTSKRDGAGAEDDHVPNLRLQLKRMPRPAPRLGIDGHIGSLADVEKLIGSRDLEEIMGHFVLRDYDPHPSLKFKVAV